MTVFLILMNSGLLIYRKNLIFRASVAPLPMNMQNLMKILDWTLCVMDYLILKGDLEFTKP